MAKKKREPIMPLDDERFMSFSGLIQWTQGLILQSKRVAIATEELSRAISQSHMKDFPTRKYLLNCEEHYFVIAANKLIEHREWTRELGLFASVDFSEIDSFSKQNIKDLRNMREHVVDYFKGDGIVKERWVFETPEYSADASSRIDNLLGGRLDYIKFSEAAERLLPHLLKEPIPYPNHE